MFEFSSTNKTTVSKSFAKTNTTTLQKKPERSCSNSIANIIANSSAASRIQTKLSIGKPNDKYEKEADMMADKVMTTPANFNKIQKQEKEKEEPQAKIQKQEEEKEKPQAKLQLQEEEKKEPQTKIQKQEEKKEEPQAKIQKQAEEAPAQTKIQRQTNTSESASTNLSTSLSNTKGSGETISDSTRTFMEGQFSADFSNVKVHTDRNAIGMNNELGAQAFTYGSDIYFNEGKYNPDTTGGKHLLAHELTHTMQQGAVRKKNIFAETTSPKIQRLSLKGILNKVANYIPGYSLICVILGKNPITGDKVPRTGINILKGVLGLIPVVGNLLFNRLKETGAAEKAGTWLDAQITKLDITWSGIKALISKVWDRMSIWKGISGNIAVAKEVFGPTLRRIKAFVSAIGTKLKEFILDAALSLAGGAAKSVMDVFKKGKAVFNKILDDPIGFVKNFLTAVKLGINQFATNFDKHFKNAIFGWLFGTMAEAGIELPKKFDLKGIFNLVIQILGLTYNRIRTRLVKKLGPKGETIISAVEKGVTFVKKLITEGPIALWEKMKESLGDLKKKIMTEVLAWVTKTIITKAMMKLVTMLNPVGALIQAAIAIYNTVMFFIERWNQIKTFVTSIFNSISNIAYGKIKGAANYIENTMAKGLTLLISFLARFIGLGGISKKIRYVIKKIRKPIDKALDKVIDWIINKGKAFFAKGKATVKRGVAKIKDWWSAKKKFKMGNESHTLYFKGQGVSAELMMASGEPLKFGKYLDKLKGKPEYSGDISKITQMETHNNNVISLKKKPRTETLLADIMTEMYAISVLLSQLKKPGDEWPTGSNQDPIPIKWYKAPEIYKKLGGKTLTEGYTLPRTTGLAPQNIKVLFGNLFMQGQTVRWTSGRTDSKKNQVKNRINNLHASEKTDLPSNYAIDHIRDQAFSGKDQYNNLWPLDAAKNNATNASQDQYARSKNGDKVETHGVSHWGRMGKTFFFAKTESLPSSRGGHGTNAKNPVNDGSNLPKRKP